MLKLAILDFTAPTNHNDNILFCNSEKYIIIKMQYWEVNQKEIKILLQNRNDKLLSDIDKREYSNASELTLYLCKFINFYLPFFPTFAGKFQYH